MITYGPGADSDTICGPGADSDTIYGPGADGDTQCLLSVRNPLNTQCI